MSEYIDTTRIIQPADIREGDQVRKHYFDVTPPYHVDYVANRDEDPCGIAHDDPPNLWELLARPEATPTETFVEVPRSAIDELIAADLRAMQIDGRVDDGWKQKNYIRTLAICDLLGAAGVDY